MVKEGLKLLAAAAVVMSVVAFAPAGAPDIAGGSVEKAYAASAVKAKAVKKKAGKYTVKIKQAKVNYRQATVTLPKAKQLKKAGIKQVKVSATMKYEGKTVAKKSKTVKLSALKSNSFQMKLPSYGKYKVVAQFKNKSGKVKRKLNVSNKLGIVAEQYNVGAMNGTFPVVLFTLSLWDITKDTKGDPIPTFVTLTRQPAYNWKKLPANVYWNPLQGRPNKKIATGSKFNKNVLKMSDYVKMLRKLNKNSKFNFYITDNFVKGALVLADRNKLPENRYHVNFLSDGSGTYAYYNQVFGGSKAQENFNKMTKEWKKLKQQFRKGKMPDTSKLSFSKKGNALSLSRYTWPAVAANSNVDWWVGRTANTFQSTDAAMLDKAIARMTTKNIGDMLKDIQAKGDKTVKELKALFHFSDSMFEEAEKSGKEAMIIMGTRVNLETDFVPFAKFLKKYYGDKYVYYYKGHPATPTGLYPSKQKELKDLGITDVESSIAAELILFFYPNAHVSGLSNSTLNFSYKKGNTHAYLGTRIADSELITAGELFELFFTKVDSSTESSIKALCPSGHACYLIEFKDTSKADIAIYDANSNTMTNYKKSGSSYVKA